MLNEFAVLEHNDLSFQRMFRLAHSRIELTQRDMNQFMSNRNLRHPLSGSSSSYHHLPPDRFAHYHQENRLEYDTPRIRQGPGRSRDASVIYHDTRQHQESSATSSEGDDTLLELQDTPPFWDNRPGYPSGENTPSLRLLREDESENPEDSLGPLLESRLRLSTNSQDEEVWLSDGSDAVTGRRRPAIIKDDDNDIGSSNPYNFFKDGPEMGITQQSIHLAGRRHRSYSEPPEHCTTKCNSSWLTPARPAHEYISGLPQHNLAMQSALPRPRYMNNDRLPMERDAFPVFMEGTTTSYRHRPIGYRRAGQSAHGRHESVPAISSFSSPVSGFRHRSDLRHQRRSSDFSVLEALEHSHSPLEELVHDARQRLSGFAAYNMHSSGDDESFQSPRQPTTFLRTVRTPLMSPTSALNSPTSTVRDSHGMRRSLDISDSHTAREGRYPQRLAFRPGQALTRHRSRTPIWQAGVGPVLFEDVVRSGFARRAGRSLEQENRDDMTLFQEERHLWASRNMNGGILEGTPPREGHLERLQR